MERFFYNSKVIQKDKEALVPLIIKMNNGLMSNIETEQTTLKVLALMEDYMCNFAYRFSLKSSKVRYEDYMQEMITDILPHIKELKLNEVSKASQVTSYLYYWLNDTCQRLFCSMEYSTNLSLSKAKKISKENGLDMNLISKPSSLNNTIRHKEEEVVEYSESFVAPTESPYTRLYREEIRKIVSSFGEKTYVIFEKIYVRGYKGTVAEHKKLEPLLEYFKVHDDALDMIKELTAQNERLI